MNIAGIICEYNPFHAGHAYHIAETKKVYDAVVCVMSGDFVQRGDVAIFPKHRRAEFAVRCGADLVLELPTPYSCASAERFARGGVGILSSLGVVDALSFGAECSDLSILKKCADILNSEGFFEKISEKLKNGASFASVREAVLREIDPVCADIIVSPNNLLAIEYLRALPDNMTALAIERKGAPHDSKDASDSFASASLIRELILNGEINKASGFMLDASFDFTPVVMDDRMVLSHLKRLSVEDLKNVPDVTEGLESRLFKAIKNADNLEDLYASVKTKRYALSRIRRIVLNAYLGITKHEASAPPSYARVLAMNDIGRKILVKAKKVSRIPIITKPADGKGIPAFEKSVLHSDLYALFSKDKLPSQWRISPFVLGD